ncbi:MAG: hypothetical protein WBB00_24550, partial [Mycobacterium sp.]
MTGAALALALAVLVTPDSARRRARVFLQPQRRRHRPPVALCAVAGCAAMLLWVPGAVVLALG